MKSNWVVYVNIAIGIFTFIAVGVNVYYDPPPTKEQTFKLYQDRIDWCFKQGGKAKFDYRNEYQGCDVQR